jgi:hypothetical protein
MRPGARFVVGLGVVAASILLPAPAMASTGVPAQPPAFMCAPENDGWVIKSTGNDYYECKPDIGNPQVFEWQRVG